MGLTLFPDPLYERVCDHLEQVMAMLPNDPGTEPLRRLLGDAIDAATRLRFLPRNDGRVLHLIPPDEHDG